jgi:hypothetical protein
MDRGLRYLGWVVLVALAALLLLGVAARFADGPVAIFPGGPLESGEWVADPEDLSFAEGKDTLELQLVDPPRSRTVWFVLHEGRLYVPCGFLDVPLWKQWPHEAMEDGRAVIRVGGRRFPVTLVRVTDPERLAPVERKLTGKYGVEADGTGEDAPLWIFRLDPRPAPQATSSATPPA